MWFNAAGRHLLRALLKHQSATSIKSRGPAEWALKNLVLISWHSYCVFSMNTSIGSQISSIVALLSVCTASHKSSFLTLNFINDHTVPCLKLSDKIKQASVF